MCAAKKKLNKPKKVSAIATLIIQKKTKKNEESDKDADERANNKRSS